MKFFQLFVVGLALIPIFAHSTVAQKETTSVNAAGKIAVFNPETFEDKQSGIEELIAAYKQLDAELKPKYDESNTSSTKVKTEELTKEILEKKAFIEKYPFACIDDKFFRELEAKVDELNKLASEYKSKSENFKSLLDKRKAEIVTPINNKIGDALKQFAKLKGFIMIVDKNSSSALIGEETVDVTAEFIQFYNNNSEKDKAQ